MEIVSETWKSTSNAVAWLNFVVTDYDAVGLEADIKDFEPQCWFVTYEGGERKLATPFSPSLSGILDER